MTRKRIRLGMVGGGQGAFIGAVHRIAARLDNRYELIAGALSSDRARALASAAENGITAERSYSSYQEMATAEANRDDGIEAVSIVTPNHLHAEPIIAFANVGIHVICDKPLTDTWANACHVKQALEDKKVCFLLTHNYTGYPLIRQARAMITGGELGEVRAVRASYLQDWLTTDLENQGLKQAEWRTDPQRSGPAGAVGDIGSHAFQLLHYLTGTELASVAADLTSFIPGRVLDDHADILLRYVNGARGSLSCSQISVGHENDLAVGIYCSDGSIQWRQENPNEMTVVTKYGQPPQRYTRASGALGDWAQDATRIPPGHPEGYLEAFAQLYSDIADHIEAHRKGQQVDGNKAPIPDLNEGLAGMAFIDAVVRSSSDKAQWTDLQKF